MNTFLLILLLGLVALLLIGSLFLSNRRRDMLAFNGYGGARTRHKSLTRTLESAVSQRYLNATEGSAAGTADICGLADRPMGYFNDEGGVGDACAIERGSEMTGFGIGAVAIARGDELYTAANGKVSNVAASTSWFLGVALTAVSSGDATLGGDSAIVEYDPAGPQESAVA